MTDAFSQMMKSSRGSKKPGKGSKKGVKKEAEDDAEINQKLTRGVVQSRDVANALEEDSPTVRQHLSRGATRKRGGGGGIDLDDDDAPRKRRRTETKSREMVDRPAGLKFERFRHHVVAAAYCGLHPSRDFMNALLASSNRRVDPVIADLEKAGISWLDAYQVYDTYMKPSLNFMSTLRSLATHDNPSENITTYDKLYKYMTIVLNTCEISVSPASLVADSELCAIDGKTCKGKEEMCRVSMRMYDVKTENDTIDSRFITILGDRPITMHVNSRYVSLLFGTWYLYHLALLIGQNCAEWVAEMRARPREKRGPSAENVDRASDIQLAQMFVDANHGACERMRDSVVTFAQTIEKRNQEYEKRLKDASA